MMDRRGVISMPLRLTLAILVISLSLPVVDAALQIQEREAALNLCVQQGENILNAATVVYYQGEGSMRTLIVDLPPEAALCLMSPAGISITFKGENIGNIWPDEPLFPIFIEGDMYLEGRETIKLEATEQNGVYGVMVTKA